MGLNPGLRPRPIDRDRRSLSIGAVVDCTLIARHLLAVEREDHVGEEPEDQKLDP